MFVIFKKEIRSFLSSLIGYVVMIVFLIGTGLFMWVFPQTNILDTGFADLETLFTLAPYIYLFLVPAITMRTFAEEKKSGTIELLLTRPLTEWDIVLGKYFSSLFLVVFTLLPTVLYYYSVYELGNPRGNIDSAGTLGSYIGLLFLGAVFTAIGIFASSIGENQIISFILALAICFLLYEGFTLIGNISQLSEINYWIAQLGIDYHYSSIRRGLIDSRNIIYFMSIIVLMLIFTRTVICYRR